MEYSLSPMRCDHTFSPVHGEISISPIRPELLSPDQAAKCPASRKRLFDEVPFEARGALPNKRGRKAYYQKYDKLVPTVEAALLDHGFAAHRRRSETWSSVGVSAERLREKVAREIPGLPASVSTSTVKRLFVAPNKKHRASKYYHGIIDAKIGIKKNDIGKSHPASHFCRTSVNYALEMAACFKDEVTAWSVDDKNKLLVGGGPCVDRRMSFKTYFMKDDMIHYPDHNFATGYKIIPSGYMELRKQSTSKLRNQRSRSESPEKRRSTSLLSSHEDPLPLRSHPPATYRYDKLGRRHLIYPRTGPLTLCLRGNKFHRASVYNHHTDLTPLLRSVCGKGRRNAAVIVSDNGPDWKRNSVKVVLMMGRLWRDLELDYLNIVSYAPGDSRFNMIEHSWAPLTMWLTGLQLLAIVPGEQKSPEEQTNLSSKERRRKDAAVLDAAISDVQRCLKGRIFDSFQAKTVPVKSASSHIYSDESTIDELTDASKKKIASSNSLKTLAEEYKFLCKHSVQRSYQLEFVKCQETTCRHCSSKPIRARTLMTFLREFGGGCCFTPQSSDKYPGHYKTWEEMASLATARKLKKMDLDEGLSSSLQGEYRRCKHGCRKVFQSRADKDRHDKILH